MDSAKCYHATEESGVLLRLHIILLDDAERSILTLADSIHLMTSQSTVEIQFSFMIYIADGNGIGIVIITKQCQCASSCFLQYSNALIVGKLLALTPHFTKLTHNSPD